MKLMSILLMSLFIATGCQDGGGGDGSSTDPNTGTDVRDPADNNNNGGDVTDGNGQDGDGQDGQTPTNPDCVEKIGLNKIPSPEVIIDDNTWYPSTQLTDAMMKANAKASVYVRMTASRCSGFMVSQDIIMTNNHCIGNASEAKGVYVRFDYNGVDSYKQYTCDEFIGTNSALDFTLVRCKGSPGKYHPQVVLGSYQGKTGYPIYVAQQNCDYRYGGSCTPYQKIGEGELIGYSSTQVRHNADTLGGSSGSPIFDADSHKVIGIHNAGQNTSDGGGTNYGIQMYKIVDYIKSNFPSVSINASADRDPAWNSCD